MAELRIVRKQEYYNRRRKFGVYLDDAKIGEISNGTEEIFTIPEGQHTVKLKVDWCGSPEQSFSVQQTEMKTFYAASFKYGSLIGKLALVILLMHLAVKMAFGYDYVLYAFIPFGLYQIYYLTFGRKNYLRLTDEFEP